MSALPQELFDRVIDYFGDDHQHLLIFTHVSQGWALSSQRWLFRDIVVNTPATWNRLVVILRNKASLQSYVRKLEIKCYIPFTSHFKNLCPKLSVLALNGPVTQLDILSCCPDIQHLIAKPTKGIERFQMTKAAGSIRSISLFGSDAVVASLLDWFDMMASARSNMVVEAALSYGFNGGESKERSDAQARLLHFLSRYNGLHTLKLMLPPRVALWMAG
jgi:hypothetical protein